MEARLPLNCSMLNELPSGYELIPWHESLTEAHAQAKFGSFHCEIDATVFPCLGDFEGCRRLIDEISNKRGFLPESTWLLIHRAAYQSEVDYCGTVQGIVDAQGIGTIQNLGVVAAHRGLGLGSRLLFQALDGFRNAGNHRASLEVTAQNVRAVKLYQRMGFRRVKTLYKAVEVAYT